MKLNRIAVAVALAMAGGGALAQQAAAPVTAETSIQIYGHLDLSIDTITKGIAGKTNAGGATRPQAGLSGRYLEQSFVCRNPRLARACSRRAHPLAEAGDDRHTMPDSRVFTSLHGVVTSPLSRLWCAPRRP